MKIPKIRILLAVYIIFIAALFLYYLFPSEAVKAYLSYRLSMAAPGIKVKIERVTPTFPPGLTLHQVGFFHREAEMGSLESINVRPDILSLFRAGAAWSFKGKAYAGELSGKADIAANSAVQQTTVDTTLTAIQIKGIPAIQQLTENKLSGILNGKIDYTSRTPNPILSGNFMLLDCRVDLAAPIFNQGFLTFRDVKADLVLNNQELTIKQCSLEGNEINASISGSVDLSARSGKQALNLVGTIKPHHVFLAKIEKDLPVEFLKGSKAGDNGFSFKINGTLDVPEFSFN